MTRTISPPFPNFRRISNKPGVALENLLSEDPVITVVMAQFVMGVEGHLMSAALDSVSNAQSAAIAPLAPPLLLSELASARSKAAPSPR